VFIQLSGSIEATGSVTDNHLAARTVFFRDAAPDVFDSHNVHLFTAWAFAFGFGSVDFEISFAVARHFNILSV
jgi:hypothetical protein